MRTKEVSFSPNTKLSFRELLRYEFHQKNIQRRPNIFFISLSWKQYILWEQVTCSYLRFLVLACHDMTFCCHKIKFSVILWKKSFKVALSPTNISVFWFSVSVDHSFFKPCTFLQTLDNLLWESGFIFFRWPCEYPNLRSATQTISEMFSKFFGQKKCWWRKVWLYKCFLREIDEGEL